MIKFVGAEATIEINKFVIKKRIQKSYRIFELDKKLRRSRTRKEAKILEKCRLIGINVPKVIRVKEEEFEIVMEKIDGIKLKDAIESDILSYKELRSIFEKISMLVVKMHSNHIIHYDLTTSNILLKNREVYIIDFGLSFFSHRIEDMAMDIFLLESVIHSTHPNIYKIFKKYFFNTYKKYFFKSKDVLERLEKIEKRRRYK